MGVYTGKNCIVTGGAGFIGQNIVRKLLKEGAKVYVIDNFSYGASPANVPKGAIIIKGDVRKKAAFEKLPRKKYDFLFHFAAPSSIVLFNENLSECNDITINGFYNAISFCVKHKIKLIYPSTGSLYAGSNPPNSENSQLVYNELNSYANDKLALEAIARAFSKEVETLGLRIFAGYGPSERHKGRFASVAYSFCEKMMKGESPEIWGDGTQERDFVYIDDVVDVILELNKKCTEKVVNIGSGEAKSFNEIIAEINKLLPKKVEAIYIPKPKLYLEKTLSDNTLLRKYYKRKLTPLRHGIKEIIKSLNTN